MSVVISSITLILSESSGGGSFLQFYNEWLNIPFFEAWKFLNLFLFLAGLIYVLKRPISEGFKAKREAIRSELIKAEQDKQAALVQLIAVEAKLAGLEAEKDALLVNAKDEAEAEKKRQAEATEVEIKRLSEQSEGELTRYSNQTRVELRRYSAEESVRLAEEKLRSRIDSEKDARLVKANIQEIGGLN